MAEEFSQSVLIKVVAQICQMVGFERIMTTPLAVLADILKRFILKVGRMSLQYSEHCGSSGISLRDLSLAFHDSGVLPSELTEFLKCVSPLPKCLTVPKFPVTIKNLDVPRISPESKSLIKIENVESGIREDVNNQIEAFKMKIKNSDVPRISPTGNNLIKIENVQSGSREDFNDQREALKIKISFSKIRAACEGKKSKNKKKKRKKKKKRSKYSED